MSDNPHVSVLLTESIEGLNLSAGDVAVDCTVGAGGHTERMLAAVAPGGRVVGLDRDETALKLARDRLAGNLKDGSLTLVQAPFSEVAKVVEAQGLTGKISGILADIGVSSMHIDQAERGFSFQKDGPLDMRMDQSQETSAATLLADLSAEELARLFFELGEEPQSRQIARRIVERRAREPLTTTKQLADLVKGAVRYKTKSEKHPATKVFQALRMAVNDELGELERLIGGAFNALKPGGRLAVISFHSLEDRIVKNAFIDFTGRKERNKIPRDLPISAARLAEMTQARGEIIKPFPLGPGENELKANPRSRSAKLRVIQKLGIG